jgi:hypothetical protein
MATLREAGELDDPASSADDVALQGTISKSRISRDWLADALARLLSSRPHERGAIR